MTKALIAMSGGVDSSVAAYLMQKLGYDCDGAMMQLWDCEQAGNAQDAKLIAQKLNMDFFLFDYTDEFRRGVVDSFVRCYEAGGTPNPCVECNQKLKFGTLLDKAISMGYDCVATGHYAVVEKDEKSGRYLLYRAADKSKDQSYFLAGLTQAQLSHVVFPLGLLSKEQVRQVAEEQGFVNAKKKDSQDICFIPDGDYLSFMERYTGKTYPAGDYLDLSGNVVGRHSGAVGYTIGQRKGLGLAMGEPVYVCRKDMENNTVTVGSNDDLFQGTLQARDFNWIAFSDLTAPIKVTAKIRYRHIPQPATVYPEEKGIVRVEFDTPQRAITPGQAVVLYDGDMVIGSGTIL